MKNDSNSFYQRSSEFYCIAFSCVKLFDMADSSENKNELICITVGLS